MWQIPPHFLSIDTGRKIGSMISAVKDIMLVEAGGKMKDIKIQVDLDLTKPLLRGLIHKYRQMESWVEFRYEQLPMFYFYCGYIGHNEKLCAKRKEDLRQDKTLSDQYSYWLRGENRKLEGMRDKRVGTEYVQKENRGTHSGKEVIGIEYEEGDREGKENEGGKIEETVGVKGGAQVARE